MRPDNANLPLKSFSAESFLLTFGQAHIQEPICDRDCRGQALASQGMDILGQQGKKSKLGDHVEAWDVSRIAGLHSRN